MPILLYMLLPGCSIPFPSNQTDAGASNDGGADDTDRINGCRDALPIKCGDRLSHDTTVQGLPDMWSGYNCSQRLESGREIVYAFQSDDTCQVIVRLANLQVDLDLFLLEQCDPWLCTAASATPVDIQGIETVTFTTEADRAYFVIVDGYDGASGTYVVETDCLCGTYGGGLADGEWVMQVNRQWDHESGNVLIPLEPLDEEDYQHVDDGASYSVEVSGGRAYVAVGDPPLLGELISDTDGKLKYDLTTGTFAGGRFVVWAVESELQAELTIYGSGVPIASSERGTLTVKP